MFLGCIMSFLRFLFFFLISPPSPISSFWRRKFFMNFQSRFNYKEIFCLDLNERDLQFSKISVPVFINETFSSLNEPVLELSNTFWKPIKVDLIWWFIRKYCDELSFLEVGLEENNIFGIIFPYFFTNGCKLGHFI